MGTVMKYLTKASPNHSKVTQNPVVLSNAKGQNGLLIPTWLTTTHFFILGWPHFQNKGGCGRYPTALSSPTSQGYQCLLDFTFKASNRASLVLHKGTHLQHTPKLSDFHNIVRKSSQHFTALFFTTLKFSTWLILLRSIPTCDRDWSSPLIPFL